MAFHYISSFKTWLRDDSGKAITAHIWGDPVRVLSSSGNGQKVRARKVLDMETLAADSPS